MKLIDTPVSKLPPIRTRRLVLLAATALIAPALLVIEATRGNAQKVAGAVAVFAAILFILVVLRMFTLLREISNRDAEIALEKQKNEVIEIVSHQLRTPISIIMLYTEELLGTVTDGARRDVTTIKQANQRLIELVNALLYSTQLDMGTKDFKLTPQDLGAIASEAVKEAKGLLDEKQITVELTTEPNMPPVATDHDALKTAIGYLINNAARYSQDEANLRISINVKRKDGNGVVMVHDSGVGIPDEDQPKIFTRLFRASNAVTSFPDGVGLGLYVAKTIIERMGGHIGFTSRLNHGSTFYISLPIETQPRTKE